MAEARTIRVAIVGAGPRGTSVLERLLAQLSAAEAGPLRLAVELIDPYPAGPGHVWRTDQSRLYLMNTQSFYPTLVPGRELHAISPTGASFDAWRLARRRSPEAGLSAADVAELAALESTGFPSRALYGRYLRWTFERLVAELPANVTVRQRRTEARAVRPGAAGGYVVELADETVLQADKVVLALGHVPSRLGEDQVRLATGARKAGLRYWPPAVPNDVDWSALPEQEPVLVRGMGLNFFDIVGQLTEGRGGRFVDTGEAAGEAVRYLPSGREPLILAASRRGVPYRAKAELQSYYPKSVRLGFLTADAVSRLVSGIGRPGFDHDLWPLLLRDTYWAYYETLCRVRPRAVQCADFLPRLNAALQSEGPHWEDAAVSAVRACVEPAEQLDLPALVRPFAGRHFAGHSAFDAAVHDYLQADARGSAAGEDDPVKMAIGALNAGRAVIKTAVADGGIPEASWLGELRGWFEGFVEGLASGPPALRTEQLAALARAGVVRFLGPDPVFSLDEDLAVFTAASPWVGGDDLQARELVEAMAPANRVLQSASTLLEQLLADGLVRPKIMLAGDGEAVATSGLDVSLPPYRALNAAGKVADGLYVLGLQLSSVQWGTAIAAEADSAYPSGYQTLKDADAIASHVLARDVGPDPVRL
ncbi:FAD/NAD(P)-binding protein [Paenarthrobacter sp. Z7-10]|uniref:FAD/NAD(P)-binding protein n=1 Tax=Paenarthrobacter sp. Z7-10 TaxID=2787635 RepID=UPI0022A8F069|nr:FAD/NAD(P)-binding protein [Paenarthrobacter sp. Z7-10]MCZ2402806.1 FAD/NAD(P)-binding protein [Paenarthrobacter sp. Z7-10]